MFVLGIDAGGTKTVGLLADGEGRIVGEARGGGANLQAHGELEAEKVLHAVIEEALGDRQDAPAAVCVGMAGVDREGDAAIALGILRRLGFKTRARVVNDALIALIAGAGAPRGVVLISGTGSIAYGVDAAGEAARAGGWGYVLGDEGSGYWIGRRALLAAMRASDGRGPATRLTPLLLRHYGLERPDGLVHQIYDGEVQRHAVAALGALVEQARAEGDHVAREILADAGEELALAVRSVVTLLEMRGETFPTVLAGGMFHAIPWLADDVTRRLAEIAPRSLVRRLDVEPALGAVHLALQEARGGVVRVPPYRLPRPTSPATRA